jgi:transcriptional regulator GlxA family with amidase domain
MAVGGVGSWHASPEEIKFVADASSMGMLIGAQASALITLAEAGILDGKNYCYYKDATYYRGFDKGNWKGRGVIRDGQLITSSSCPYVPLEYGKAMKDYTAEFADALVTALGG